MNRRKVLLAIMSATFIALLPSTLFGKVLKKKKFDKRLLGTWRSDKELTIIYWRYTKELAPDRRERFENLFGKLTIKYTESHAYSEFDETKDSCKYEVIGRDDNSVAIIWHEKQEDKIQHIHFEENDLYYVLVGYNVEFFRRVS